MTQNYKNIKEYKDSWYALTPNRLIMSLGALKEEVNCDVCVIGAGFVGLSAALELLQRGLSVVILESQTIAVGASGKNNGHIVRSLGLRPGDMLSSLGPDHAKFMANVALEGIAHIFDNIHRHQIQCDLKFGHLTAASKKSEAARLNEDLKDWAKLGHEDMQSCSASNIKDVVATGKYVAGLMDPKGGHLHPLNYALGLTQAVQKSGGKVYENSPAIEVIPGAAPKVLTLQGSVTARFVLLANGRPIKGITHADRKVIGAVAHMMATEPIGEKRARNMLPKNTAVTSGGSYYSLSNDHRLLFGGDISYSGIDYPGADARLRQRMLQIFPAMKMTLTQHCWAVPLTLTRNRLPDIGRISPQIYYAHGFGSSGIVGPNILGKIIAQAIAGTAGRFDAFEKIPHAAFAGDGVMKRPLFVLAMLWYKLRCVF